MTDDNPFKRQDDEEAQNQQNPTNEALSVQNMRDIQDHREEIRQLREEIGQLEERLDEVEERQGELECARCSERFDTVDAAGYTRKTGVLSESGVKAVECPSCGKENTPRELGETEESVTRKAERAKSGQ